LQSSYTPLGPVAYLPVLAQTPVSSSFNDNVSLSSGGGLGWNSQLGLTIGLAAKQGSTALSQEVLGALRVNYTASLNLVVPPDYLLPGGLYAVWIGVPLRFNSASGFLSFSLPSQSRPVDLKRRNADGSWTPATSIWNQSAHTLTYSPADPHMLNGTFAIVEGADVIYAKCDGACSGKTPCFSSVMSGIGWMQTNTIMNLTQETFAGDVVYNSPEVLTLAGGWDGTFAAISSSTVIHGTLTIQNGTVVLDSVVLY
jgi:hypothetical protein